MKPDLPPLPDLFVVGTDTGVGKSVVCLLLMQLLLARNYKPFYLKPFQTGCPHANAPDSDALFIYRNTGPLKHADPSEAVICCHAQPKAPWFAARAAGERIDPDAVRSSIASKKADYTPLIIEGSGGLLVPVGPRLLMIDMVRTIACRPLLVAKACLGTINHTLLSLEALLRRGLDPLGVILVDHPDREAATDLIRENMEAIEHYSGVAVGGVIGVLRNFEAPPARAYRPLCRLLFEKAACCDQ